MSKLPSPRTASSPRPTVTRVNPAAAAGTGRRVLAVGKIGPAVPCRDCGGFGSVKVRIGGRLVSVHCRACTPSAPSAG